MLILALFASLLLAAPAHATTRLPSVPAQVAHNPAERLIGQPIEDSLYDPATRCSRKQQPGMIALQRWLEANVRGVSWGTNRCEKWGKHQASLHSEGRAIDWHLDAHDAADRRAAERLARLLLAPDSLGDPQALARRMGVGGVIFECGYGGAGMTQFEPYDPCYKQGKRRKRVDPTVGHIDHLHIGLTKAAAARRTSFWSAARCSSCRRCRPSPAGAPTPPLAPASRPRSTPSSRRCRSRIQSSSSPSPTRS